MSDVKLPGGKPSVGLEPLRPQVRPTGAGSLPIAGAPGGGLPVRGDAGRDMFGTSWASGQVPVAAFESLRGRVGQLGQEILARFKSAAAMPAPELEALGRRIDELGRKYDEILTLPANREPKLLETRPGSESTTSKLEMYRWAEAEPLESEARDLHAYAELIKSRLSETLGKSGSSRRQPIPFAEARRPRRRWLNALLGRDSHDELHPEYDQLTKAPEELYRVWVGRFEQAAEALLALGRQVNRSGLHEKAEVVVERTPNDA